MELSNSQKNVHDCVIDCIKNHKPLTTLGGYAGTGKTFLVSEIRKTLELENPKIRIAFVTFTGKASSVLRQKLGDINPKHFVGTIHSLIYRPIVKWNSKLNVAVVIGWERVEEICYDLIIIDEASMVSKEIFEDLKLFNIDILAVGDHGQLPPVQNSSNFSLMINPEYRLEEIYRQALDNPIIILSEMARKSGSIPFGVFKPEVAKIKRLNEKSKKWFNEVNWGEDSIVLCALNKTRVEYNAIIRKNLNFTENTLYPGERLICLRNNKASNIFNGQLGMLMLMTYEAPDILEVCIQMDGEQELYNGLIYEKVLGKETYDDVFNLPKDKYKKIQKIISNTNFKYLDYFDWGYCITVHKSQGSEWKRVVLLEERAWDWDDSYYAKWLYTGITRSAEKLIIMSYD